LINRDAFAVGENPEDRGSHVAQVVSGEPRRGENRPPAQVRSVFVFGHRRGALITSWSIRSSAARSGEERAISRRIDAANPK